MDPRPSRRGVVRIPVGASAVAAAIGVVAVVVAGAFLFGQGSGGPGASPTGTRGAAGTLAGSPILGGSEVPAPATSEMSPSPSPSGEALLSLPIETAPARGPDLTARENRRRGTNRWEL